MDGQIDGESCETEATGLLLVMPLSLKFLRFVSSMLRKIKEFSRDGGRVNISASHTGQE